MALPSAGKQTANRLAFDLYETLRLAYTWMLEVLEYAFSALS